MSDAPRANSAPNSLAEAPAPSLVDASGCISADVPCLECEYNLRRLDVSARCPECGRSVALAVQFFTICPVSWLAFMCDCMTIFAVAGLGGTLLGVSGTLLLLLPIGAGSNVLLISLFGVFGFLPLVIGFCFIPAVAVRAPPPFREPDWPPGRIGALSGVAACLLMLLVGLVTSVAGVAIAAGVVLFLLVPAVVWRCCEILRLVHCEPAARRCRRMALLLPAIAVLLFAFFAANRQLPAGATFVACWLCASGTVLMGGRALQRRLRQIRAAHASATSAV